MRYITVRQWKSLMKEGSKALRGRLPALQRGEALVAPVDTPFAQAMVIMKPRSRTIEIINPGRLSEEEVRRPARQLAALIEEELKLGAINWRIIDVPSPPMGRRDVCMPMVVAWATNRRLIGQDMEAPWPTKQAIRMSVESEVREGKVSTHSDPTPKPSSVREVTRRKTTEKHKKKKTVMTISVTPTPSCAPAPICPIQRQEATTAEHGDVSKLPEATPQSGDHMSEDDFEAILADLQGAMLLDQPGSPMEVEEISKDAANSRPAPPVSSKKQGSSLESSSSHATAVGGPQPCGSSSTTSQTSGSVQKRRRRGGKARGWILLPDGSRKRVRSRFTRKQVSQLFNQVRPFQTAEAPMDLDVITL